MFISSNLNNELVPFLAQCCQETYHLFERDGDIHIPAGFELSTKFRANNLLSEEWFGFVIYSPNMAVIAFRGTDSEQDWLTDAYVVQENYPYLKDAGKTHKGFLGMYSSCRPQLINAINTLPPNISLYITGHSLGGALAVLCALDIAANTNLRPFMVNFGAPRVGCPSFAAAYNARVPNSIRVVNIFDAIPHLPLASIKLPYLNETILYKHVDTQAVITNFNKQIKKNHSIDTYLNTLLSLHG